jgi:hypothetical protein
VCRPVSALWAGHQEQAQEGSAQMDVVFGTGVQLHQEVGRSSNSDSPTRLLSAGDASDHTNKMEMDSIAGRRCGCPQPPAGPEILRGGGLQQR